MSLDGAQAAERLIGAVAYGVALTIGGLGALRARGKSSPLGAGMAERLGPLTAYLLTAVPYYLVCALLWRPLPVEPSSRELLAALLVAPALGLGGLALYAGAHAALGAAYDVSGGLGTVLHDDATLVTTGPYRAVRHPMYLGIALGGLGGLLLYRTWTFVWVLVSLVAIARKARIEDDLLARRFGEDFARYRAEVPGWLPRLRGRPRTPGHRSTPAASG